MRVGVGVWIGRRDMVRVMATLRDQMCRAFAPLLLVAAVLGGGAGCEEPPGAVAEVGAQRDAGELMLALTAAGFEGPRMRVVGEEDARRYEVILPASQVPAAVAVLGERGLPRPPRAGMAERFAGGGFGTTNKFDQRVNLYDGLAGELERQLELRPAIRTAAVSIGYDPEPPYDHGGQIAAEPHKASVTYSYLPDAGDDVAGGAYQDAVKQMVAGAVHGLAPADVTVFAEPFVFPEGGVSLSVTEARGASAGLVYLLAGAAGVFGLSTAALLLAMAFKKPAAATRAGPTYSELPSYPPQVAGQTETLDAEPAASKKA